MRRRARSSKHATKSHHYGDIHDHDADGEPSHDCACNPPHHDDVSCCWSERRRHGGHGRPVSLHRAYRATPAPFVDQRAAQPQIRTPTALCAFAARIVSSVSRADHAIGRN